MSAPRKFQKLRLKAVSVIMKPVLAKIVFSGWSELVVRMREVTGPMVGFCEHDTFGVHQRRGISWQPGRLSASHEGLCL